jgi:hypothetical protein
MGDLSWLVTVVMWAVTTLLQVQVPEQAPKADPTSATQSTPCDPGFGFPEREPGCPDPDPLLGRVTSYDDGRVTVQPIRVWVTGSKGERYAAAHGLDYPFANDYYQRDVGEALTARVTPRTVCTGSIEVDFPGGLADHPVDCAAFGTALGRHAWVTAALWFDRGTLVQLSELYRP